MVLLNLISLWVDSVNNQRIILLSLSLLGHFLYMVNLFWALPFNGDILPDLCKNLISMYFYQQKLLSNIVNNSNVISSIFVCSMLTIDIVRLNYYQFTSFIEITKYQKKYSKYFFTSNGLLTTN